MTKYYLGVNIYVGILSVVLMDGNMTIAAAHGKEDSLEPWHHRVYKMCGWFRTVVQDMINAHHIKDLNIVFLKPPVEQMLTGKKTNGVFFTPRRHSLGGALHNVTYDFKYCKVSVGFVERNTAKAAFVGRGKASLAVVAASSTWAGRSEMGPMRSHLAMAQAAAVSRPTMFELVYPLPLISAYLEDGAWRTKEKGEPDEY